jgi:hypothetical protein
METLAGLEDLRFSSTIEREMQRQRPVTLGTGISTFTVKPSALLLVTLGVLSSCGTDEGLDSGPTTRILPNGGSDSGTAASSSVGGESSGGVRAIGGSAGTLAGEGPDLGGMPFGGSAQAGAPPTLAGAGGNDSGPTEQLSFGPRIPAQAANARDVAREYNHATFDDCRTRWVTDLFLQSEAQQDFLNELVTWNLRFWGCQGEPVDNFALIYGTAPLSAGDATLLIEHYIAVATEALTLSPLEIDEMRAALQRLSAPLIADPSPEPSQPDCDAGGAGAGGAASEPVGGAGAGGAAPTETAGPGAAQ